MNDIGEYARQLFLVVLDKQPYHWYQTTRGMLSLQKKYDVHIINLACHRALSYGAININKLNLFVKVAVITLREFKLSGIVSNVEERFAFASHNQIGYSELLEFLCEDEVNSRTNNSYTKRLK